MAKGRDDISRGRRRTKSEKKKTTKTGKQSKETLRVKQAAKSSRPMAATGLSMGSPRPSKLKASNQSLQGRRCC